MVSFTALFDKARYGLDMLAEGRKALDTVQSALKDGKVALDTKQLDSLSALLAKETNQSREASADLQSAITEAKAKL